MNLYFRHFGQGQPVIILHGLFGQSDNWVTIGRRIADRFSVYIPDLRNHGQSPHAAMHSYPAMVDDLTEFIDEQRIENPIIIGHSMGGKVAMAYTLENFDKVDKLVIVDISPRKYPERLVHTRVITEMMRTRLDAYTSRAEAEKDLSTRVHDPRIRMFILKNLYYKMPGKLAWRLNLDAINNSIDQLFDGVASENRFTGPALFVRGGRSDYIVDEDIPLIKKYFPSALIKTIPGASHWVHADAPEELCALLSDFLGRECNYSPD